MRLTPIDAPPAAPPRVSILSASTLPDDGDARWQNGVIYSSEACPGIRLLDPCVDADAVVVVEPADPDDTEIRPVYGEVSYRCQTRGVREEYEGRARRALALAMPYAIERELATGELAAAAAVAGAYDDTNPRLQAGAAVTDLNPAGAVPPARALALLENALGDLLRGAVGTIHARRGAAAILPNVTRDGNVLSTRIGTRVLAGAGYPGAGPDGVDSADGETWLYGTGPTAVRLGPPEVPSAQAIESTIRRDVNVVEIVARQLFAASFDGCALVAVRMAYPTAT